MKVAVLGAGSWGTALATVLTRNEHETILWARREQQVDEINQEHRNGRYLPGVVLPTNLVATHSLEFAVKGADVILFSVPSNSMAEVVAEVKPFVGDDAVISHAVKGFHLPSRRRMSQLLSEELGIESGRITVISGPSHAEEVVAHMPTTVVVASTHKAAAELVQDALMNQVLRVYTNPDVVGAELGGSLKNIIALGVGIADGLGFGDNAKAALMTRGLAEMARLGLAMGASALTFAGLSGVGDLIVTCTSQHSRNFRAGRALGQGLTLDQAREYVGMAIEGIPTTRAAVQLALEYQVEMPIATAIHDVLFQSKPPTEAVEELMGRARSHELEEVAKAQLSPMWLS